MKKQHSTNCLGLLNEIVRNVPGLELDRLFYVSDGLWAEVKDISYGGRSYVFKIMPRAEAKRPEKTA